MAQYLQISCSDCSNHNCLIKKQLALPQVAVLDELKSQIKVNDGSQFIFEGGMVQGLYFVQKGRVKVFQTGRAQVDQILRFATPGDIVGHRGFATNQIYSIGAAAIEPAIICFIPSDKLRNSLESHAAFAIDFMTFYAQELQDSERRVRIQAQWTVRERLVEALLCFYDRFGDNKGYLGITLSRKEYAAYIGTSEEQIIRTLSQLKSEELVRLRGKFINILNYDKLLSEIKKL